MTQPRTDPSEPVRAMIFDLDGTLLDTLADLAGSVNEALAARGRPVHPMASYRRFVGDGIEALLRRALPASDADDRTLLDALIMESRAIYERRFDRETRPYPGVPALLASLQRSGAPTAVLSNKPHELTRACVERLLRPHRFAAVVGAADGVPRKPDPSSALAIAESLAIPPAQIAFVGDSAVDVRTAQAAGMLALGVAWGFRGRVELEEAGAAAVVEAAEQLMGFVRADR